mmetsp:Transcript_22420/g.35583  ORF Transcript_22420/g.35583 Transcript_22420/m.35583 type:complete len:485 (+) Transcript_22420:50-1504(+)
MDQKAWRGILLLLAGLVSIMRGRRVHNSLHSAFSTRSLKHRSDDDSRLPTSRDLLSLFLTARDSRRPPLGRLRRPFSRRSSREKPRRQNVDRRNLLKDRGIALESLRGGANDSDASLSLEDFESEAQEAEDVNEMLQHRGGSTSLADPGEIVYGGASISYTSVLPDSNGSQYVMASEWELRNLERHKRGEINLAELGIENLKYALQDPEYLRETFRMLQDPETMEEVKTLMENPEFQEQAKQAADEMDELAAAENRKFAAAEAAGENPKVPETWWWTAMRRAGDAAKFLFSPAQGNGHVAAADVEVFGNEQQWSGFDKDDDSWRHQRKKIWNIQLPPESRKRALRDLRRLKIEGEELGIFVEDSEVLTDWIVKVIGQPNTLYEGEIYRLRVRFHPDYPRKPPEVVFMRPAPVHEHIYSDGKICLNILYEDWTPEMDIKSLCLSLLSMLSSAKLKRRPPDNDATVTRSLGQRAKDMTWYYHDEKC